MHKNELFKLVSWAHKMSDTSSVVVKDKTEETLNEVLAQIIRHFEKFWDVLWEKEKI